MKIHLIKSSNTDSEMFTKVVDLLKSIPGPLQFECDAKSIINFDVEELYTKTIPDIKEFEVIELVDNSYNVIEELVFPLDQTTTTWSTLFKKCVAYRKSHKIPNTEFVILLTDVANENNWFSSLDEKMLFNGFVHTSDWEHYIEYNPAFPIAYEIIELVLQKHMINDYSELQSILHENPIGCVNDLCFQKTEVTLKLRTGDICSTCLKKLSQHLTILEINHSLALMDSLRTKMLYSQNFNQRSQLSKLVIDNQKRIFLPEFSNIEIKLRPLEKALYLLFLAHPEGIYLSNLCDHKQELYAIYAQISSIGMLQEMQTRIDAMTNVLDPSASEKISKIKRSFVDAIGLDLAANYYIKGGNGEKKSILLDRNLVANWQ